MALDRDKMLAAMAAGGKVPIYKSSIANMAAGYIASLWRATGNPLWLQGAIPAGSATPTDDTAGGIVLPSFGANTGRIYKFNPTGATVNTWLLYDRLAHMGGLSGTVITPTNQTVNLNAETAITAGRAARNEIEWYVEIYTDIGTTASNLTVTYTDVNDVGSKTITITGFSGASPLNRSGRCVLLVPSDGVQIKSIQTCVLSASTLTAGSFGFTARKCLASVPQMIANVSPIGTDAISIGVPMIKDTSCLEMLCQCTTTATGVISSGELVWGQVAE